MSDLDCIILVMQINWTKYTYVCDPDECDSLVEYTCGDTFGFPSGDVRNFTCPCGRNMQLVSVEPATIQPTNERNKMETAPYTYNPNQLVTIKKIVDGEPTYESFKVVDLEGMLYVDPVIDVIESLPNGTHITHNVKRTDISEFFRIKQYREARIEAQEKQIGQVIDNMTAQGWYNPNTDKEEVLRDLCEIFSHEPKQEVRITGTLNFDIRYDCPLDEIEDFDARYFLQDTLSLEAYNGDVIVESFDVDDADVDWD